MVFRSLLQLLLDVNTDPEVSNIVSNIVKWQ